MNAVKVLIAGGGTGGHVFPAVAVAQEISALAPDVEIVFVGTERGLEARVVPELGYAFETLPVRHLKGSGLAGWIRGLTALPLAGLQALRLLRVHRPSVVVSVGGYAAGPVTFVAALAGIPTAIMEQNSLPGLTNRLLGRVVDRCFVSFEETSRLPSRKCEVTGNPVRRQIIEAGERSAHGTGHAAEEFRLLVTGGSGGAGSMNAHLPGLLASLPAALQTTLVVRHQAGRGRSKPLEELYEGFAGAVEVVEFIEDMAAAYAWADLVVCRAGATTLAELLVLGQPAVLIPFPGAADNHQEKNALASARSGAAVVLGDHEIDSEAARDLLVSLLGDRSALTQMRARARALGRPLAGRLIAERILALGASAHRGHGPAAEGAEGFAEGGEAADKTTAARRTGDAPWFAIGARDVGEGLQS
jgi:UDP-N-acetylglucosamine--N-acetylmuramyl-(pentapeptide) pyrophosphoryl-undecaprenol N-acetylglucosamine transferase